MSEKHIEKAFLYFILFSILFHVAIFGLVSLIPPEPSKIAKETTMVDLKDLPEIPPEAAKPKPKPKPKPEPKPTPPPEPKPVPVPVPKPLPVPLPKPVPVPLPRPQALPADVTVPKMVKGGAPKPSDTTERKAASKKQQGKDQKSQSAGSPGKSDSVFRTAEKGGKEMRRGEGIFKAPAGDRNELAKLFPSAKKMQNLEETYREKYRDAEQGDTRMIDTGDPIVAMFSHRLLVAANDSLELEGSKRRLIDHGVGVVKVTINRDGSIDKAEILENSASPNLDDTVVTAIKKTSYVGPLPKKWPHEQLKLIWIFYSAGGVPR